MEKECGGFPEMACQVYVMENSISMDDWGEPPFYETLIWICIS